MNGERRCLRVLLSLHGETGIPIGFVFSALSEPGWRSSLIGIVAGGGIPMAIAWLYERIRGHEGLGMGLSICRSIIAAHGGRLWADADQPRGVVFQFTLPAPQQDS